MTTTQQPNALRLAQHLEQFRSFPDDLAAADELRRLHARNAELEDVADMAIKRIEELEAQLSEYKSEMKTKEVHTDSERRNAIAKLLGLGDANFAWSYLHDQIKDLVKCEEELIALRKQADAKDAARYRWLRDNDWNADKELGPVIRLQLNAIWDVSIDKAMEARDKQENNHE